MPKFRFEMSAVVEARSLEDGLNAIASHISTVNRQMASNSEDIAPEFKIEQVDDKTKAVDLTDRVSEGPIELELDPKSPAGVALAEQQAREKTEREQMKAARSNEGRSDAEILADFSAKEQAALK